ncbi:hypothetical protein [Streptomyces griseiscabiei]|uniref:Secreted protein n=1 Tax=Streptomyces griseiscabiei TaxID=2993540 RepID=A0ABU4LAC8_9ACTN|nr:hypothetical protein [Streptomyces griseiscabiei]MDX2912573.1 hypothetical protein [Streptomyces griseiscabiei]
MRPTPRPTAATASPRARATRPARHGTWPRALPLIIALLTLLTPVAHATTHTAPTPTLQSALPGELPTTEYDPLETAPRPPARHTPRPTAPPRPASATSPHTPPAPPHRRHALPGAPRPAPPHTPYALHALRSVVLRC